MRIHSTPLMAALIAVSMGATACSENAAGITAPEQASFKKQSTVTVDELTSNLFALQNAVASAGLVNVTLVDVVDIGNINVDVLVDVKNVLNNNDIDILNIAIGDITIDNVLNNLLRDADILNKNQIVVGILSGGQLVIQNVRAR